MKYQYRIEHWSSFLRNKVQIEYDLNRLGEEGWELINIDLEKDWYYFKKAVE